MSNDYTETLLVSRTAYEGKLLTLKEDKVKLPDGGSATREYVLHQGAAMVIPHSVATTETNRITWAPPACAGKFIKLRVRVSAVTIWRQPNGLTMTPSKRACATVSPSH